MWGIITIRYHYTLKIIKVMIVSIIGRIERRWLILKVRVWCKIKKNPQNNKHQQTSSKKLTTRRLQMNAKIIRKMNIMIRLLRFRVVWIFSMIKPLRIIRVMLLSKDTCLRLSRKSNKIIQKLKPNPETPAIPLHF